MNINDTNKYVSRFLALAISISLVTLFVLTMTVIRTQARSIIEEPPSDAQADTEVQAEVEANSEAQGAESGPVAQPKATEAQDMDDDGDGIPTDAKEAAPTTEIDKASPKLMERLEIDRSSPLLYQGISVSVTDGHCPESGDCDDGDTSIQPGVAEVHVSGSDVRNWNGEQKEQARQRIEAAGEETSANDFGIRVALAALENEGIVDIKSDVEQTEITFETQISLFGFLPTSTQATASAEANGEVRVSYPWYGFLARKGEDRERFSTLTSNLRAQHDALISIAIEEEGAPANRRKDSSDSNSN